MDLSRLNDEQLFEHLEEMAAEVKTNHQLRADYDAAWHECCRRGMFHGLPRGKHFHCSPFNR